MDAHSSRPANADYGDRQTYGEVVLSNGADDSALAATDWRQGNEQPIEKTAREPSGPRLYRHARPGTLAQERDRAREIVDVAKRTVVNTFEEARFGKRLNVASLIPIVDAISASVARNCHALPSITRLKSRSEYTYLHSVAVCGLMVGLAQELRLGREMVDMAGLAGLLHDIGKAAVPLELIDKPGPLTDDEFAVVKLHPERGAELLSDAEGLPSLVVKAVMHHHERMDGRGYPHGVPAANLDLIVRMATICDVYDAVTSTRTYKASWSPGQAISWMRSTTGHFDPAILASFVKMLGAFPPGTLVRLRSDRLALVVDDPDGDPLNPSAMAFHCAVFDRPLRHQIVTPAQDPILSIESPAKWRGIDWPTLYEEAMNVGRQAPAPTATRMI